MIRLLKAGSALCALISALLLLFSCQSSCAHRDADDNRLCDGCGKPFADGDEERGHQHIFNKKRTGLDYFASPATCTEAERYFLSCSCGEACEKTFSHGKPKPHSEQRREENRVEPTCTSDGSYQLVIFCTDCQSEVSRTDYTVHSLGHIPGEPREENRVEPTCTSDGSYQLVIFCTDCQSEVSRTDYTVHSLGHIPDEPREENRVEPTCSVPGSYEAVTYCAACGVELGRESLSIPAAHLTEGGRCVFCNEPESTEGITFKLNPDGKGYTAVSAEGCTDTDIVFGLYNNLPVTEIADSLFYNRSDITSVTLGRGVKRIGANAFRNCHGLTALYITDLSAYCEISIPGIYSSPLYYAGTLYLNGEKITELNIPEGVTKISGCVFQGMTDLTRVTLPESLTEIGVYAFSGCTALREVNLPDSLTKISGCAFENCAELKSIELGDKVAAVDGFAFSGCTSLESAKLGGGLINLGEWAFADCAALTSVTVGEGLEYVGMYAFSDCVSLTSLTLPDSLRRVEQFAFSNCRALESLSLPDGITYVGDYAFTDCPLTYTEYGGVNYLPSRGNPYFAVAGVTDRTVESLTLHPDTAFILSGSMARCTSLAELTLPDGVLGVGCYAFNSCKALKTVTLGRGVGYIENRAFFDCAALTEIAVSPENGVFKSVNGSLCSKYGTMLIQYALGRTDGIFVIPEGVTHIGDEAFEGCKTLVEIDLSGVVSVGDGAFNACTALTRVTVGESVTLISKNAFSNCPALSEVIFESTEGWIAAGYPTATRGTSVSPSTLSDPTSAKDALTDIHKNDYLIRLAA